MENSDGIRVIETNDPPQVKKSSSGNLVLLVVALFVLMICVLLAVIAFLIYRQSQNQKAINSFDECVAAGNPVLATFPPVCTADGKTFTAVVTTTPQLQLTTTPTTTTTTSTPTPTVHSVNVKVFFDKDPASYDDPNIAVAVNRSTTRSDVATFSIEQLIAGPKPGTEMTSGLFTPVHLSGSSNCGGKDFTITVNDTTNKATIKFCKDIVTAGVLEDSRIQNVIGKTLTQFTNILTVTILDKNGHCFGDESGMDLCLT
jgi:hypothetical protein